MAINGKSIERAVNLSYDMKYLDKAVKTYKDTKETCYYYARTVQDVVILKKWRRVGGNGRSGVRRWAIST